MPKKPVVPTFRVLFNEITKRAVQQAFEHPKQIDENLVDAQQARRRAFHVLDALQTLSLCTNLGDTKTLAAHPASTSHGRLTEAQRMAAGISQGLIRVSVGLEHVPDMQADLLRGLDTAQGLA